MLFWMQDESGILMDNDMVEDNTALNPEEAQEAAKAAAAQAAVAASGGGSKNKLLVRIQPSYA